MLRYMCGHSHNNCKPQRAALKTQSLTLALTFLLPTAMQTLLLRTALFKNKLKEMKLV